MAVLPDADRAAVWAEYMRDVSSAVESCAVNKTDLRAAIDAADIWANSNASSFNTALPLAARTNLTAAQKARLLNYVVRKRWVTGA